MRTKTYHLVASTDKDSDSTCVSALLDRKHFIPGSTESEFTNDASVTELLGCKIFEPRHNTTICGDRNQLYIIVAQRTFFQAEDTSSPQFQVRQPIGQREGRFA